jgi:hypothetical protein
MIDRRRRDDRYLEWKVWVFCLAAVFGLGGIYLDTRWLTGVAIVLLTSAMLLRLLPGGRRAVLDEDESDGEGTGLAESEDAHPVDAESEAGEPEEAESSM